MKKIDFILILLLCSNTLLLSQVKDPGLPFTPEINSDIDMQNFRYKVRITVQGSDNPVNDEIILDTDSLTTADNRIFKIKDISRLSVLLWEKRNTLNRYSFYPSRYEFTFRDYKKLVVDGNIVLLNKIKISKNKNIYFYFYDSYKNGRWIISGVPDFDAAVTKPASGCVLSIELIQ